ncbi:pyruvate carboxylase subunit A [Novimethylophilus kurashikiensis]|uniref:Pyruvate carboxylase subunit A n=1 Tax=Novimethylophilus kurashikiensis TaxID=1825523 RepID=A0A2R5F921_9PROT|nr:serine hydrolase domain-containing protein [Novimethylophilus kurashikiensis]GBG14726.1 pyruvate carboxylase subunit A [Novimethylophilus kurashikiensis]
MNKRLLPLLLVVALWAQGTAADNINIVRPEDVGLASNKLDNVSRFMRGYVDDRKMAGAVVLIARHGKIAYFEPFGQADVGKPMQRDSMFRIASMTKPLISVAALQLYEEGKLLLSDPVAKYIPEFAHPKVLEMLPEGSNPAFKLVPAKRDITVKHLLTHTAGLPYDFDAEWFPKDRLYQQMYSLYQDAGISSGLYETEGTIGDMVKRLGKLPLARQPGEAFEYGMAADVLGRVVEVASGMKLDDYMHEHIFKPLKMKDTYFFIPESEEPRLAAVWSSDWQGKLERVPDGLHREGKYAFSPSFPYKGPKTFFSGGCGAVSTAYDYYRFAQMLLNKGELDGTRILSRKTVELMTTNQIGDMAATTLHDEGWKFGLGVAVQADRAHYVDAGDVGAFEWAGIFSTRFSVDPREEKITIFLSQTTPFSHHFELWDKLLILSSSSIGD